MTFQRILLHLVNNYLHGFKIQDSEYILIRNYLQSELQKNKPKEKLKALTSILGKPNPLTK